MKLLWLANQEEQRPALEVTSIALHMQYAVGAASFHRCSLFQALALQESNRTF